jgi:hypothetical protein
MNENNKPKRVTNIPMSVVTMFTDSTNWNRVDLYIYHNSVEKIGVVLATKSPNWDSFALNKKELERVIAGKRKGKIDEAYVVAARVNGSGPLTYQDAELAEVIATRLEERLPIAGRRGPFWALRDSDIDPDASL